MIEIRDLSVSFGDVEALSEVSLTVERGELLGLVGPNGAGKTTMLGAVNGLVDPIQGTVTVGGNDVRTLSARELARRVATVPQETTLSFSFPVREVVAMGRTPYRSRFERVSVTDREHTERAMKRTNVARFADRTIDEVSGGERQRVVLARALCQDSPTLLLDEPTASLDVNHQIRTLSLVQEFVAEGRAACCAIHDLSLAARFCDRLALLADGKMLAVGTPEEVLTERHIERAFDTDVVVTPHPVTGTVDVTAIENQPARDARVHVLGGGPRCACILTALSMAGFEVSAGVLSTTDAALTTADALGVGTVTAEPFAPVGERTVEEAARLVRNANIVVAGNPEPAGPNRALVKEAERLVVVGTTNEWPRDGRFRGAHVVEIGDVVAGVEAALDAELRRADPPAADD